MPKTKKVKEVPDEEMSALADRLDSAARLFVRSGDRKVGLRNVGPNFWFYNKDGHQILLEMGKTVIIDQTTFERNIMPSKAYTWGHVLRDDSILIDTDIPAPATPRPVDAIFDHELIPLVNDEAKCLDVISQLNSRNTIQRILNTCGDKKKYLRLTDACNDRIFMIDNELPDNFYTMDVKSLMTLIDSKYLGIKVEIGMEADDVRARIENILR